MILFTVEKNLVHFPRCPRHKLRGGDHRGHSLLRRLPWLLHRGRRGFRRRRDDCRNGRDLLRRLRGHRHGLLGRVRLRARQPEAAADDDNDCDDGESDEQGAPLRFLARLRTRRAFHVHTSCLSG